MRRFLLFLLSLALALGISIPAASAAGTALTTEQKFEYLKQRGIFSGFSDGSAGLYQSMTREQFAQVLYLLLKLPGASGLPKYKDVAATRWSYQPVQSVSNAGLMVGTGNKTFDPDSPVTVEQLAAVLVRAYGLYAFDDDYVAGKTSPWARESVGIALQRKWIPQMKDYTTTATRGLLVEASYEVYIQTQEETLNVLSVTPTANRVLRVALRQSAASADASRFVIRDVLGAEIAVRRASLSADGFTVTLDTDAHVAGRAYTLTVDGIAWAYTAIADDIVKPTVSSFSRQANGLLQILFSEPVDAYSATQAANYAVDQKLKLTAISLSSDNRTVTISTAKQSEGTAYHLTVRNVRDLAGNAMDAWSGTFVADNTVPKAVITFNPSTARITIAFNEKVNPQFAQDPNRYQFNPGLAVSKIELDNDGRTVYLTTAAQKDATVYTLTVSGIIDLAGNTMQTQTFVFGGVANPVQPVQLSQIAAIDENTLRVSFNRAIPDGDIASAGIVNLTDNGSNVSMSGWQAYKSRSGGDGKTFSVQFRTAGNPNPALFRPGHVYGARVTGIANLVTAGNADEAVFAGTINGNADPMVQQVTPIGKRTVKIQFSEPVKNVSAAAFRVREKDGATADIDRVDTANNQEVDSQAVVTEVILRFEDELEAGHEYVMTFRGDTVTDAAGWNGIRTKNGAEDYAVSFRGV